MQTIYQAKLINNRLEWIDNPPPLDNVYVSVTILTNTPPPKRQMPAILKGCGQTLGDILNTSELSTEWTPSA